MRFVPRSALVVVLAALALSRVAAQDKVRETKEQYQGAAAEEFLKKARVVSAKDLGVGVTLPKKLVLEMNGVTHNALFKSIDDSKSRVATFAKGQSEVAFQDSWQCEIPGYVVDQIIGLGWVPATVERTVNGETGSVQWWVESKFSEFERNKQGVNPPNTVQWHHNVLKMRLFDELIYNVDRHANNVLITEDFDLRLIDHSRAFRPYDRLKSPEVLTQFSRELLEGIKKLDYQDLRKRVGRYLQNGQIQALIKRRDLILALADKLIKERGAAAVLY